MTTSLSDYWDMLYNADWTYETADDQAVWRAGSNAMKKLHGIAKQSPEHKAMMHAFRYGPWPPKPMEKTFRTGEDKSNG